MRSRVGTDIVFGEVNQSDSAQTGPGFHILTKPVGPICNLNCHYCFYLEKEKLYPGEHQWRMSDEVLEAYIRQYIGEQPGPEVYFGWQGGEPTLAGIGFFAKVVELQRRYADDKKISNAMQTNGVLLDDAWCEFFAAHQFLVGLSIDGPRELHDKYRVDKRQQPTFDAVARGLDLLKKHQVDFNTLTVVNRANSKRPLDVYRFLKDTGSQFLQFIPLVERREPTSGEAPEAGFAEPPQPGRAGEAGLAVTEWSVEAGQYGEFLCAIFDEWVHKDVGRVFVQLFDVALGNWMGLGSSLCVFAEKCGATLAIEHNGDLFSCDHYVYPRYRLGNVMNQSLGEMVRSDRQLKFGSDKLDALPRYCRECEVRFACNGECPKHRFIKTPDGEEGLNYLCPAYKRFFNHVDPCMRTMAGLLSEGYAAAEIMGLLAKQESSRQPTPGGKSRGAPRH
jgi:uncharacterized protein